jgi:hypothetical protein
MFSYCLIALVAYRKYQNWWNSRHAVTKQKDNRLSKCVMEKWGHSIVKTITKIFAEHKDYKGDKKLDHIKEEYIGANNQMQTKPKLPALAKRVPLVYNI